MAVKYFIEYDDVIGVSHRLDIYDDTFSGVVTQVDGNIKLSYSDTDDSLESIRGQGLSVELEADETLNFSDLWSGEEKSLIVEYKRNSVILFKGWLNPDGFFEDYVNSNWVVTFDCIDGLGYLKDLSFVDSLGFPFSGKKKYIDLLAKALVRTGLSQNIYVDIQIRYTGLTDTLDVLNNVYANTERYYKDDDETIMSCEEVIRGIIEPFGAVLIAFNGAWYIFKPNQLFNNSTPVFYAYNYLGVALVPSTVSVNIDVSLGSNIDGFALYHCSENQQIKNVTSLGAYRINYKYGLSTSLILNKYLHTANGTTVDDWTIISNTYLTLPAAGGNGVTLSFVTEDFEETVISSNLIDVLQNIKLDINFIFDVISNTSTGSIYFKYVIKLEDNDTTDVYYLDSDNTWFLSTVHTLAKKIDDNLENKIEVNTSSIPVDGKVTIIITTPGTIRPNVTASGSLQLTEVTVTNTTTSTTVLEGEFHTVQREDKPSAKVKDIKEVATGDNPSDIYEGTLYKSDSVTPTETWLRKGIVESKPLLQIMGEETLRMSQSISRVFSGDVFGHFNYMSVVTINGLSGKFMVIAYDYDTKSNIVSAIFKQIYGGELTDIDYEKTFDYGETVKPTIKG